MPNFKKICLTSVNHESQQFSQSIINRTIARHFWHKLKTVVSVRDGIQRIKIGFLHIKFKCTTGEVVCRICECNSLQILQMQFFFENFPLSNLKNKMSVTMHECYIFGPSHFLLISSDYKKTSLPSRFLDNFQIP